MIVSFLWLIVFFSFGSILSNPGKQESALQYVARTYPLGMAMVVISTFFLWIINVPVTMVAPWILSGGLLLAAFRSSKKRPISNNFRIALAQQWPFETITSLLFLFTLAITTVWQIFVHPVVWDALVLYDFRALRIAEGWLPQDFFSQFVSNPRFITYDFLHPFFPSVLGALSYATSGSHTPIFTLGLQLTGLIRLWSVFHSKLARLLVSTLLVATPVLLTAAVEGYGVWYASLFWLHLFLTVLSIKSLNWRSSLSLAVLLSASLLSRHSEPYWGVFLIWGVFTLPGSWKQKLSFVSLPSIAFAVNHKLVLTAQSFVVDELQRGSFIFSFPPVGEILLTFLQESSLPPFLIMLGLLSWLFPRGLKEIKWYLLLAGWLGLLGCGLFAQYFLYPNDWKEVFLSLPRAELPIIILSTLLISRKIEFLSGKKHLLH